MTDLDTLFVYGSHAPAWDAPSPDDAVDGLDPDVAHRVLHVSARVLYGIGPSAPVV